MKNKLYKMGNRTKDWLKKFVKGLRNYIKHNALFITFVLTTLLEACFLRFFTVKNYTAISPILADFAVILLVGSFAYFFKPKNRL